VELELQPLHQAVAVAVEVDHPQKMVQRVGQVAVVQQILVQVELELLVKEIMVAVNRLVTKLAAVVGRLLLVLAAVE
jgi:hypothetical protein